MSYSIGDGLVSLALAGGIVGYYHVIHRTRRLRLEIVHQERLIAMEKGIPLPEFPLEQEPGPRRGDPRIVPMMGIVLAALSLGAMIMLSVMLPVGNKSAWIAPLPIFFLGLGLLGYHLVQIRPRL